jgi:prepilin-type N-terminal cleavage/methylation domain-containing protein/prepilin-type processing-associated H-X9-DG protein
MLFHIRRPAGTARRGGFTLVELLVVIGIIALLMSILLPTLGRVRDRANMVKCMSNLRELTRGWLLYAQNNRDWVPVAMTGNTGWVRDGATDQAIIDGSMYPFVNSVPLYKCPADVLDRNRSYSANDYWNGSWGAYAGQRVQRLSQARRKSDVFVFIEEWDRRGNFQGFNQGSFVVGVYPSWVWVDYPAFFHGKGTSFSFADGHAEHWTWGDPRTLKLEANNQTHQDSEDLRAVQRAAGLPSFPNP